VSRRLEESYDEFGRIEDAFRAALDESLRPRSPELLYELVQRLGLPEGSLVVDVGCGDGRHSYCLAERFGFSHVGIDPFPPSDGVMKVRFRRKLLYAARLLPDPERYQAQFGEAAYEIMLGDCLWCTR
jgi:SAM-dependent methyltransferase